ncbi:hypothetical protein P7F88_23340 [Vibrio hannami]|nr:hypothetical protein [Vibrio hannami]MDG3088837.1 hypothetical protein [Vibrio hannami]
MEKKLKQLRSVAAVYVEEVTGDTIRFEVHLLSSELDFENEVLQAFPVNKPEYVEDAPELEVNNSDVIIQETESIEANQNQVQVPVKENIAAEVIDESVAPSEEASPEAMETEDANEAPEPERVLRFEWIN